MTTSDDQLSDWTGKKLQSTSQSQTCTKKRSWSWLGRLLPVCFLNPSETITSEKYVQQINEPHQKLQCLKPALVNRKGSILHHNVRPHMAQPMLQKLNKLGYKVLLHLPYSPDLLPADYHFFKYLVDFLQGKCFHSQQNEENAFQEFNESQRMDFNATAINLFHVGKKNVFIVMVPILINKDVFEPSFNDLQSMIQNCNYFCTNLI